MRVANVIHHFGGLSESFIPDGLEQLERIDCQGWILTMSVKNRDVYPFPPDERILVARRPSTLRRLHDRARGYPGTERFASLLEPRSRGLGFDLVHAHFGWSGRSGGAVARRLDVPFVVTFHGTDATVGLAEAASRRGARGNRDLFDSLDTAFCVSRFIEGKLRRHGYEGRVDIVPAGVRLERFAFRPEEPPEEPFRVVQLGRLVYQKGLDLLLTALPRIAREVPAVHLDVVGQGPSRADFERLAARLGVADRVTFHGPVLSVIPYLERGHVLVAPSREMPSGAAEGSPVVTKEAQAVGISVVATDTGGMAETFPPEHRADLVPGDDPDALAERVIRLASDRDARRVRTEVARAWIEREFDAGVLARRTLALYEDLTASRPSSDVAAVRAGRP
jgi:glycosyltransferase involved in cell wall biosynthesis